MQGKMKGVLTAVVASVAFLLLLMTLATNLAEDVIEVEPLPSQPLVTIEEPAQIVTEVVRAPYPGKVVRMKGLLEGSQVSVGEALLFLESSEIDRKLAAKQLELERISQEEDRLKAEEKILEDRLQSKGNLCDLAKRSIAQQQKNLEAQQKLYASKKELFESASISEAECLAAQVQLGREQLALIGHERQLVNQADEMGKLTLETIKRQFKIKELGLERRKLLLAMDEIKEDRASSKVLGQMAGEIGQFLVADGEHVARGQPVVKIVSTETK